MSESLAEHVSQFSFAATLERLTGAIEKAGMTIFATIDHAKNARGVGLAMPPATVLIYGSPKGGTPVMVAAPLAALDLPLRVLVLERADGTVGVAFHPIAAALLPAGMAGDVAARLEPAQQLLVKAIAL